MKIDGYAGWNTSANTIGTAIAEAVDAYHYKITKAHLDFLGQRYIEDIGYCSLVRTKVTSELDKYSMNYFDVKEKEGVISRIVKERLNEFISKELSSLGGKLKISSLTHPWKRMFEIDVEVDFHS